MDHPERMALAASLMADFGRATGLTGDAPPHRYLWTDAFAVCNYLGLYTRTGDPTHVATAVRLVDQVHGILGRHREDSGRSGWISGLSEAEGLEHPTAGGLRIGKPRPDRSPDEPYDPATEWDRDGQYFHYLTRWMHALGRVWEVTGDTKYHRWAIELADAAYRGFRTSTSSGPRLWWKMSVGMERPVVRSSGHHDPLDGLLTMQSLLASAPDLKEAQTRLDFALRELGVMCHGEAWATDDPLGAGSLFVDAYRCRKLRTESGFRDEGLCDVVLSDAVVSVESVSASAALRRPAESRLAFREIGLAIGIHAAVRMLGEGPSGSPTGRASSGAPRLGARLRSRIERHRHLADDVESFWAEPEHRQTRGWKDHRHISSVMLATALEPEGYLG